jgi:mannose-6-phosphate isomerase class I
VPMQPFKVRDMVCYQPGTAFTKKIFASGFAVFDVSALDMNTELKDQHAIGELILTCLEGEGIVSYRDTEQVIHTGENFRIVRGDNYTLKTNGTQCKVSQLSRVE